MSELTYRASDASAQSTAYVESLAAALGSRDPIEVLTEMPSALRNAVARLTTKQEQTPEREGKWSVRHVVQHLADSDWWCISHAGAGSVMHLRFRYDHVVGRPLRYADTASRRRRRLRALLHDPATVGRTPLGCAALFSTADGRGALQR